MVRLKVESSMLQENINVDDASNLQKRAYRQAKREREKDETSDTEDELARTPSPPPVYQSNGRSRKSENVALSTPHTTVESRSISAPQPKSTTKRSTKRKGGGGGNKKKYDHEYCLTCSHYGRACGGRRELEEGCAVCREPNKTKGEKLRECLWRDEALGIYTYQQAREALKARQTAVRAATGKMPRGPRQQPTRPSSSDGFVTNGNWMSEPDPLGLVTFPSLTDPPPPTTRPLNVLPPDLQAGTVEPTSANGHLRRTEIPAVGDDENETIVVNPSRFLHELSQSAQLHESQVISLEGPANVTASQFPARTPFQAQPVPLVPPPREYEPFFDPRLNAYVLPVYPRSNLLPPQSYLQRIPSSLPYMSPYEAPPTVPLGFSASGPPQPIVFDPHLPPPNTDFTIPRPAFAKARPLDKSGKPCKKWSRSNSNVTTLGGYAFNTGGWKRGTNEYDTDGKEDEEHSIVMATTPSTNVVSTETATQTAESSELSSAIDIDESMLDIASDQDQEPDVEDRLQFQIKSVTEECTRGQSSTDLQDPTRRDVSRDENYNDFSDSELTSDEGQLKTIPLKLRSMMSRTAVTKVALGDGDAFDVKPRSRSALLGKGTKVNGVSGIINVSRTIQNTAGRNSEKVRDTPRNKLDSILKTMSDRDQPSKQAIAATYVTDGDSDEDEDIEMAEE